MPVDIIFKLLSALSDNPYIKYNLVKILKRCIDYIQMLYLQMVKIPSCQNSNY